jgi:ABC-type Co2+ transport system permease subunit
MHISEGVLSPPVLAAGWALAAGGLALGLKKTKTEALPRTALISAVLFLASLVHVPVGPSSIHLTLLGLAGVLLGWSAVPALFVALLLQALLFQFGGILSLGVNTAIMGTAALSAYGAFSLIGRIATRIKAPSPAQSASSLTSGVESACGTGDRAFRGSAIAPFLRFATERSAPLQSHCARKRQAFMYVAAFIAGFLAIIVGSILVIIALTLSDMNLKTIAVLIFAANIPLAVVEGAITVFVMIFLGKFFSGASKLNSTGLFVWFVWFVVNLHQSVNC